MPPRCRRPNRGLAAEDGVMAMLRYSSGLVGVVNHTWSAGPHNERSWVTLSGSEASIAFELGGDWIDTIDASGRRRETLAGGRGGLSTMVREFRQCVQEGRPPTMNRRGRNAGRGPGAGLLRIHAHRRARPVPLTFPACPAISFPNTKHESSRILVKTRKDV